MSLALAILKDEAELALGTKRVKLLQNARVKPHLYISYVYLIPRLQCTLSSEL